MQVGMKLLEIRNSKKHSVNEHKYDPIYGDLDQDNLNYIRQMQNKYASKSKNASLHIKLQQQCNPKNKYYLPHDKNNKKIKDQIHPKSSSNFIDFLNSSLENLAKQEDHQKIVTGTTSNTPTPFSKHRNSFQQIFSNHPVSSFEKKDHTFQELKAENIRLEKENIKLREKLTEIERESQENLFAKLLSMRELQVIRESNQDLKKKFLTQKKKLKLATSYFKRLQQELENQRKKNNSVRNFILMQQNGNIVENKTFRPKLENMQIQMESEQSSQQCQEGTNQQILKLLLKKNRFNQFPQQKRLSRQKTAKQFKQQK